MTNYKVGRFAFDINGPHPVWVRVKDDGGGELRTIRHNELRDLAYGIKRAMREAKILLKEDKGEV